MKPAGRNQQRIAAVRRFNRFYTRQIGVLRKTYLDSAYSLGEMRVLYEIAHQGARTATDITRALDLDAGYLSRVLRNFERIGLITRKPGADDARQSQLALTADAMLGKLDAGEQALLTAAMETIETLLAGEAKSRPVYTLRQPRHGDFGWIVSRHAELYAQEYGWTDPFEGLCAQIVADFAQKNDPARERCWIADMNSENVGTVMLVKDSEGVARIRLLLVDPKARDLKLGQRLVDECITFARAAGYKKITLWTHSILTAARHIYEKAGFKLMRSEKHKSWGKPVVSEHWDMKL
jgi:ribosomal protein S18 acetylase RimI-like enzyme